jgi:LysM repeat protein
MRATFLAIILLFVGCWILTFYVFHQQQVAEPLAMSTPTVGIAVRMSATPVLPEVVLPPTASPTALVAIATPPSTGTSRRTETPTTSAGAPEIPTPRPSPTAVMKIYVVVPGDTLVSIAARYNLTVDELAAANHLKPPYTLQVGDRLVIPVH